MKLQTHLQKLFKEHEFAIVMAFQQKLPKAALELFQSQLQKVGIVQRAEGGFDVNMYSKKLFGAKPLECEAFPGFPEEVLVAVFKPVDRKSKMTGKLWFVHGKPFSIEFEGVRKIEAILKWSCELKHDF